MCRDDLFDDGQPQSGPAGKTAVRAICTIETVEDVGDIFRDEAVQLRFFFGSPELGWKMAWSDRMVSFYFLNKTVLTSDAVDPFLC